MDTSNDQQLTETPSIPSKPILKVGFTDYFATMDDFFIDMFSRAYEVVRDDENPDYLVFADETFGQNNKNFNDKNVIKLFFTGENRRPWNYDCHVGVSFDHYETPRHYRLPLYALENWVNVTKIGLPDIRDVERTATAADKHGFCSFVVANGGCQDRNHAFDLISQYKKIDSAGPLFNNTGFVLPRDGVNAQKSKYDFIRSRKFNLCYENGSYPGYVTEKVFHALFCNTIPIYWGSPTIEMDFNPAAMISRHDFDTDEDMINFIIEVDNNDELYDKIVQQPIINPRNNLLDLNRFVIWFHRHVYRGVINQ